MRDHAVAAGTLVATRRLVSSPYSLRTILWLGIAACVVAGLTVVFVLIVRVSALAEERGELHGRYEAAAVAHEQRAARRHDDPGVVREALRDADQARTVGGRALAAQQRRIELTVLGGVLAIGSIVAAVFLTIAWILRRTATPLERLARAAIAGDAFPPPDATPRVREVDALAWALHELDAAVRVRNEQLAAAHDDAVELSRFGEHIQQVVDPREVVDGLASRLIGCTEATAVHTLVRAVAGPRLQVAQSTTEAPERMHLPVLAEPMRCRAVRTLKPVAGEAGSGQACRCPLVPAAGAYLCEPMLAAGEVIGVVNVQAADRGQLDEPVRQRVEASIRFAAPALASLRLLAAARERALRDPVTGAYNRVFLEEFLRKQIAIAGRRELGVALVAIDLADTHDAAVIGAVAAAQHTVRTGDAVIRDGAGRLLIVLVDSDLDGGCEAAARLETALGPGSALGVTAFPDHGDSVAALVEAAERALYRAKVSGERVTAAETRDTSAFHVPDRIN
jgi:diguanylate cyclase (GGDEF)-like protein